MSIVLTILLSGCNNNYNQTTVPGVTVGPIALRAFVSNPVHPSPVGGGFPAIEIVDAANDTMSVSDISLTSLAGGVIDAGMMAVSPKRDRTLMFSPADAKLAIISNAQDSLSNVVTLPGQTQSFFVAADDKSAFVAVPGAPTLGQAPGAVLRIDITIPRITATIPVPGAHNLVPSPSGNQILVFSDNSDVITVVTPGLIDSSSQSVTQPCSSTQVAVCTISGVGLDRPIWGVFAPSGATAYVMNCGQECGGAGAGACMTFNSCTTISTLDMTQTPPALGNSVAVPAASIGLLQGNNLFVAGTPTSAPDNSCAAVTPPTAAAACGQLSLFNISTLSVTSVAITDGYHNRMEMGANGQLFVGSHNCTNINTQGQNAEMRGCLTIVNTSANSIAESSVVAPPDNGDVTGIEPIPGRNVVYVCEGGKLRVYDTTTDKLEVLSTPPGIVGQAIDVKVVDF